MRSSKAGRQEELCRSVVSGSLRDVWHLAEVQEYIDVSRQRLGRPKLDLLQFYW